ncbi:MAG: methyltransferase [Allosphingosinicella sp.]
METSDSALLRLLEQLAERGYRFVAVTPETHRRVIERERGRLARDLRDVFGWSRAFEEGLLPPAIGDALKAADAVSGEGDRWRSRVRVASEGGQLFLHSAYPTEAADSVFFGPDSYRFVAFLRAEVPRLGRVRRLVDIGTGSGVGAIVAAGLLPDARSTATDINPLALSYARINARHSGVAIETLETPGLAGVEGPVDLVIGNPPFVADPAGRLYRDGGGESGGGLSLDWALEAARRLEPGGTMLLYTGSAISEGRDRLREALEAGLGPLGCRLRYAEIDPDIFGELLDEPAYAGVERIAAVGAVISKCGGAEG